MGRVFGRTIIVMYYNELWFIGYGMNFAFKYLPDMDTHGAREKALADCFTEPRSLPVEQPLLGFAFIALMLMTGHTFGRSLDIPLCGL